MLILIAHGSRDPNWRASVESMIQALQADLGPDKVRLAYMDHPPPTLGDVVAEAVGAGMRHLRVLPLFLANEGRIHQSLRTLLGAVRCKHLLVSFNNEGHVDRDIRPVVDRLRRIHRSVEIELLPALVHHASFRQFLAKLVVETEG